MKTAFIAASIGIGAGLLGQAASTAQALPFDFMTIVERAGTIGVMAWMVVWFQRKLEKRDSAFDVQSGTIAQHMEKQTEAMVELSAAVRNMSTEVRICQAIHQGNQQMVREAIRDGGPK